jgi:hypothetical protein
VRNDRKQLFNRLGSFCVAHLSVWFFAHFSSSRGQFGCQAREQQRRTGRKVAEISAFLNGDVRREPDHQTGDHGEHPRGDTLYRSSPDVMIAARIDAEAAQPRAGEQASGVGAQTLPGAETRAGAQLAGNAEAIGEESIGEAEAHPALDDDAAPSPVPPRKPGRPPGLPKTGGRAKGTRNKRTVIGSEALRSLAPKAKKTLSKLLEAGDVETRARAAALVLAYVYGKPRENVETHNTNVSTTETTLTHQIEEADDPLETARRLAHIGFQAERWIADYIRSPGRHGEPIVVIEAPRTSEPALAPTDAAPVAPAPASVLEVREEGPGGRFAIWHREYGRFVTFFSDRASAERFCELHGGVAAPPAAAPSHDHDAGSAGEQREQRRRLAIISRKELSA